MSKSVDNAEHEVEQSRERLTRTLDHLQSRFSRLDPKNHVKNYALGDNSLRETSRNLVSTFRRDPIPILMIGAGASWLIYEIFMRTARNNGRQPLSHGMAAKDMTAASGGSPEST